MMIWLLIRVYVPVVRLIYYGVVSIGAHNWWTKHGPWTGHMQISRYSQSALLLFALLRRCGWFIGLPVVALILLYSYVALKSSTDVKWRHIDKFVTCSNTSTNYQEIHILVNGVDSDQRLRNVVALIKTKTTIVGVVLQMHEWVTLSQYVYHITNGGELDIWIKLPRFHSHLSPHTNAFIQCLYRTTLLSSLCVCDQQQVFLSRVHFWISRRAPPFKLGGNVVR